MKPCSRADFWAIASTSQRSDSPFCLCVADKLRFHASAWRPRLHLNLMSSLSVCHPLYRRKSKATAIIYSLWIGLSLKISQNSRNIEKIVWLWLKGFVGKRMKLLFRFNKNLGCLINFQPFFSSEYAVNHWFWKHCYAQKVKILSDKIFDSLSIECKIIVIGRCWRHHKLCQIIYKFILQSNVLNLFYLARG